MNNKISDKPINQKNLRRSKILKIVSEKNISTQAELVDELLRMGIDVTQATVSRDIKELGITRVQTGLGPKYVAMHHSGEVAAGRLMKVFSEAVTSVETAHSFVILKTLPGTAQAAASALDSMHLDDIVGSLAGDDTIFIATHSADIAEKLKRDLIALSTADFEND